MTFHALLKLAWENFKFPMSQDVFFVILIGCICPNYPFHVTVRLIFQVLRKFRHLVEFVLHAFNSAFREIHIFQSLQCKTFHFSGTISNEWNLLISFLCARFNSQPGYKLCFSKNEKNEMHFPVLGFQSLKCIESSWYWIMVIRMLCSIQENIGLLKTDNDNFAFCWGGGPLWGWGVLYFPPSLFEILKYTEGGEPLPVDHRLRLR